MVCPYCSAHTRVINSRAQKQLNQVWRRRQCLQCGAVFTSHELLDYAQSLAVQTADGKLLAFKRERLFLSILKCCQHRKESLEDAVALTDTVLSKVAQSLSGGLVTAEAIANITLETLRNFDHASAVQYEAYHAKYEYS